ncbi:hypothetical protein ACFY19_20645 [Streptosporangium saharense]|uniref:hypothetical protein n=1 Tax=Streptosporangium saharense TaxID=1706840 RepID=UPI0036AE6399
MADTPEQRFDRMAESLVDTLKSLAMVLAGLPIPMRIGFLQNDAATHADVTADLARVQELLYEEPIHNGARLHIEQAILTILLVFDVLYIAKLEQEIAHREDGVTHLCTLATIDLTFAARLLDIE